MSSPSPPPPMRKFILQSSDGKSYVLEGKAALESRMIRDMIEDDCPDDVIPVPSPGDILEKVVVYCQKHAECDVVQAANYLNIDSLVDVICQSLIDKIHGKTPDEARKILSGFDGKE